MGKNNEIPPMRSRMQILSLELIQKAPLFREKYDIFHATCYPVSFLHGQNFGWNKMKEMGLESDADAINNLAKEFGDQWNTFKTVIPMTRNTVELNNYEQGSLITLFVSQTDENDNVKYIKELEKQEEKLFDELKGEFKVKE